MRRWLTELWMCRLGGDENGGEEKNVWICANRGIYQHRKQGSWGLG